MLKFYIATIGNGRRESEVDHEKASRNISLLVMDVDGTLTDGHIYAAATGEEFKAFYVRDGYAIKHLLPSAGIFAAIITGRESKIVSTRADELGVKYVYQNAGNKADILTQLKDNLQLEWDEIAYIGDDVNDIPVMQLCGLVACPSDAVQEVKKISDYICAAHGGHGAVREFVDWLLDN